MTWDEADPEGPSAEDIERFGDEWRRCPRCSREIYDQAEICPYCGHALGAEPPRVPIRYILIVMAVLIVFILVFAL